MKDIVVVVVLLVSGSLDSQANDGTSFTAEAERIRQQFLQRKSMVVTSTPVVVPASASITSSSQGPKMAPAIPNSGQAKPVVMSNMPVVATKVIEPPKKTTENVVIRSSLGNDKAASSSTISPSSASRNEFVDRRSTFEPSKPLAVPVAVAPVKVGATSRIYGPGVNRISSPSDRASATINLPAAREEHTFQISANNNVLKQNGTPNGVTTAPNNHVIMRSSKNIVNGDLTKDLAQMIIPPPMEFAEPDPPTFSNEALATASLKSVVRNQSNSMVFRARPQSSAGDQHPVTAPGKTFEAKKVDTWSVDDVGEWLESLDFGVYKDNFTQMNITGRALVAVDQGQMEQSLGIFMPLHRIKLEREIRKIKQK